MNGTATLADPRMKDVGDTQPGHRRELAGASLGGLQGFLGAISMGPCLGAVLSCAAALASAVKP